MRNRITILLLCVALLFVGFDFKKPNYSWTVSGTGGDVVIPYSGYYTITLAGSSGSANSATANPGKVLTKTLWLDKGVSLSAKCSVIPGKSTAGSTLHVYGGSTSKLYIDGVLYAEAPGGIGKTGNTVPSGITKVTVYQSNYSPSASAGLHTCSYHASPCWHHYHQHTGDCQQEHVKCDGPVEDLWTYEGEYGSDGDSYKRYKCSGCGMEFKGTNSWHQKSTGKWLCGNSPANTWEYVCDIGDNVLAFIPTVPEKEPYNPNGMSVSATNTGNGYFSIRVAEVNNLHNDGGTAKSAKFDNNAIGIVISNDTIVYCKYSS